MLMCCLPAKPTGSCRRWPSCPVALDPSTHPPIPCKYICDIEARPGTRTPRFHALATIGEGQRTTELKRKSTSSNHQHGPSPFLIDAKSRADERIDGQPRPTYPKLTPQKNCRTGKEYPRRLAGCGPMRHRACDNPKQLRWQTTQDDRLATQTAESPCTPRRRGRTGNENFSHPIPRGTKNNGLTARASSSRDERRGGCRRTGVGIRPVSPPSASPWPSAICQPRAGRLAGSQSAGRL